MPTQVANVRGVGWIYRGERNSNTIVVQHEANDGLFQAFFDKPEFREQMLRWLTKTLYEGIRKESA